MVIFRPYAPTDASALFYISLATGNAGSDASHLYVEKRLVGLIYSAPYGALMPQLVLVAEDNEGVAGFILGALDTQTWERTLEEAWWPALRLEFPNPPDAIGRKWNADERRVHLIHHPERAPKDIANAYPAHLHLNLLPRLQRRGIGSALLSAWLTEARRRGAAGAHVAVNKTNLAGTRFWEKSGFSSIDYPGTITGRTAWLGKSLILP